MSRQLRVWTVVVAGALAVWAPVSALADQGKDQAPAAPKVAVVPPMSTLHDDMQELAAGAARLADAAKNLELQDLNGALAGLAGFKLDAGALGTMHLEGLSALEGLAGLKDLASFKDMAAFKDLANLRIDGLSGLAFDMPMFQGDSADRGRDRQSEAEQRERERETRAYDQGRDLMDQGRYDRAAERFNDAASMKGPRADAALYFKAWCQNRAGQRADALATIATLSKEYPKSRYVAQAKQLESEVRLSSGQPARPENESDDDLKLMAINALVNADSEQAVPMLEKLLAGTASPKLKSRALFVLAQSNSPRARDIMKAIARGSSSPELQNRAVDYLGQQGGRENRAALAEIYGGSSDVDLKRRILRAFMVGGEKDRLFTAAQTEQNPELRAEAVQQLGVMGAHEELWQLYQKETDVNIKKRIIQAMFVGGNETRLIELARTEKQPELRRAAVRNLGIMDSKRTSEALVEIYNTEKDPEIRRAVINGLFTQSNATALVALARKESNLEMKREIVQKLSVMDRNPVATAYMVELLNAK